MLAFDPVARRQSAKSAWVVFAIVAAVACGSFSVAPRRAELWSVAEFSLLLTVLSGAAAARLKWTFPEWILGKGRLVYQRRIGERIWRRFEAERIDLFEQRRTDADGALDRCFALVAIAGDAVPQDDGRFRRYQKRTIASGSEIAALRRLGQWLSEHCQVPFTDRS